MRIRLLDSGARLLAEQGPTALTTRRVASDAETSTMAVYTHFGSIKELVRAVVDDGFERLATMVANAKQTADPIGDLFELTIAYVEYARLNPNLYSVMFGTASLGPFRRTTDEELATGRREVFDDFVEACGRAVADGRFTEGDAWVIAHQWWCAVHGYTMLELAGYVRPHASVVKVLVPVLENLIVGLGDERAAATASIAARLRVTASS